LDNEIRLMTDHSTGDLFRSNCTNVHAIIASVSRLVVDVERFEDDSQEIMSKIGMGAVYTKTSQQTPLRRALTEDERKFLLNNYYHPHHKALTKKVFKILEKYGRCLILDCHSFPSRPLPYELNQDIIRPDICIGTDPFHTSKNLENSFFHSFSEAGLHVAINTPFSGAMVPLKYYQQDKRVSAIMVEVNRSLYMNEESGQLLDDLSGTAKRITALCQKAIEDYGKELA